MRQSAVASLCIGALLAMAVARASGAYTDPEQIRRAAERFITGQAVEGQRVFATAGHLDARLRLAECAGELTPFMSPGATVRARTMVGVRCTQPAWTVYLPVAVETEAAVLVARRSMSRGDVPTAADFEIAPRRVAGFAGGYVTEAATLGVQRLRRPLGAGEALAVDALVSPPLVRRGQSLTAVSRAAGIEVRMATEAMADAGAGDWLRVRNPVTGRMLEGTVQPDGTVAIRP
jgi:flagella basal body P-ring formation protein FlgA